jgi:hypothetical protein
MVDIPVSWTWSTVDPTSTCTFEQIAGAELGSALGVDLVTAMEIVLFGKAPRCGSAGAGGRS